MSLIAHYPLNGDARDYFGNDGTPTNVTWVDGKIGQAGLFNGSSSEIDCYVEKARNNVNASISCWIKPNTLEYMAAITQQRSDGTQHSRGLMIENSSGEITAFSRNSAYSWQALNSGVNAVVGVYSHVCLTQYLDRISLFVDGELRASMDMGSYVDSYNDFFTIGRFTDSGSFFFDGQIDDVRIYDHALSAKEVSDVYRANYLTSSLRTSSAINLPKVNVTETVPLTYDNGLNGDGSTGRIVHTGHDAVFTELTISVYFRLDQAGFNYVFDTNTPRSIIFKISDSSSTTIQAGINGNYPTANIGELVGREVHFVMTYDGAVQKIFINGVNVSESSVSGTVALGNLYIGGSNNRETYNFKGKIRDLQFFARAFSEDEVLLFSANAMSVDNIGNMHGKYINESVAYNFSWTDNNPFSTDDISSAVTNGSYLRLTSSNYDPKIFMYNLGSFDPIEYRYIQMRYRVISGAGVNAQVFFTNTEFTSANSQATSNMSLISDGDWHVVDFTPYTNSNWEDSNITGWRLDPCTRPGVTMDIDYVRLVHDINPNIEYSQIKSNEFSEVGVTRGLVSWLPLIGDTKDRVTNEVATNNGATPVGDGYLFNNVDSYIILPQPNIQFNPNQFTAMLVINPTDSGILISPTSAGADHFVLFNNNSSVSLRFTQGSDNNNRSISSPGGSTPVGIDSHITIQIDILTVRLFINGILVAESTESIPIANWSGSWNIGRRYIGSVYYGGTIRDVRIYNSILTSEEVAQEYNSGKASLTKNTAFAKEFIEV